MSEPGNPVNPGNRIAYEAWDQGYAQGFAAALEAMTAEAAHEAASTYIEIPDTFDDWRGVLAAAVAAVKREPGHE